ncbi:RNA polymerase sigma factor [Ornithinibacillus scapharcae]|uniref:RNA polymerase sigma factor n=1 Tax=Ornithinibacillus scapharcae TaxID=1147159 RepID=UPI000225B267|nr:sigma-70 family RNA polymerase sigma factor [Ornithinibacillus scapharcae]
MKKNILLEELNNELNIVYRYLLSKGVSEMDAEDAVQETAYKFLRYSETIHTSNIRGWLIRVALNNYYDQCRKTKRLNLSFDASIKEMESSDYPESIFIENESKEELNSLLLKLKPLHAELLMLRYFSELSYKEISQLLGISDSAIKTNLYRARKKLLKIYKED